MVWAILVTIILVAQVAVYLHARHAFKQQELRIRKQWAAEHLTPAAASACPVCGQP